MARHFPFIKPSARRYMLLHGSGLLLIFLAFWIVNEWTDIRAVQRHEAIFNEQQSLQVQLARQAVLEHLSEPFAAMEIIGGHSFAEYEQGLRDAASVQALLNTTVLRVPSMVTMAYLDEPDSIVVQAGDNESGLTPVILGWVKRYWHALSDGRAVGFVPPLHITPRAQIMGMLQPVLKQGKFAGILVGAVDLTRVIEVYIARMSSGRRNTVFVLDDQGVVVHHRDSTLVGKKALEAIGHGAPAMQVLFERMHRHLSGEAEMALPLPDGSGPGRWLLAWHTAPLGDRKLIIALAAPDTEVNAALADIRHERHIIWGLMLLSLALMTVITYRRTIHPDIEAGHRRLVDVIEFLPDPTFVLDQEGRIIAWNRAIAEMTGVKAADMLGQGDHAYSLAFYGDRRPGLIELVDQDYTQLIGRYHSVSRDGHVIFGETFVPKVYGGRGAHVWLTASKLLDRHGNAVGSIESIRDVTHRKLAEQQLSESEERYALAVQGTTDGIWDWDVATGALYLSDRCKEIIGFGGAEFASELGKWQARIHPAEAALAEQSELDVVAGRKDTFAVEYRIRHRDGSYRWVLDRGTGVRDDEGNVVRILGAVTDINNRKQNEIVSAIMLAMSSMVATTRDLKTLYAEVHKILIEHIGAETFYIALVDPERDVIEFVYAVDEGHGMPWDPVSISSLQGRSLTMAVFERDEPMLLSREQQLRMGVIGQPAAIWMGVPLKVKNKVIGVMAVNDYQDSDRYNENDLKLLSSVSEQVALGIERNMNEEQLTHQALHDELTGLPNRALFQERLGRAIRRAERRDDYRFAVVMMDLDRFKTINDTHGHLTGDKVLIEAARRIAPVLRSVDTLARLGGDEFAILLEEFDKPQQVIHIVRRIQEAVSLPMTVDGAELYTSASVGIVIKTADYASTDELLRDSDIAMYQAKGQGKGLFRVFNRAMHLAAMSTMALEHDLERALDAEEFRLVYQPIFRAGDKTLMGYEALIRWDHPQRGLVSPAEFIPVAEETGIILPIGQWALRQACATAARWFEPLGPDCGLTMSVNLSAKQASYANLLAQVRRILYETGLAPERLKLELTETAVMDSPETSRQVLERLKILGVQLAIDDFGTGYSSLSHLSRLPVDCLKIDHSFILGLGELEENVEIVRAIVVLAQALGLEVVAEGVENEEQLEQVRSLGCTAVQGYLWGRPLDEDQAKALLPQA